MMRGILFLCVANSARSQMAEGIARSILLPGIPVWSAGSDPTQVRPEAIMVMREIGIDISSQQSKSLADIPLQSVDTIITLCAEEVCPVVPGDVRRLHWGLPDPAAVDGSLEDRLDAFRRTRDNLRHHIDEFLVGEQAARSPSILSATEIDRSSNDDILN